MTKKNVLCQLFLVLLSLQNSLFHYAHFPSKTKLVKETCYKLEAMHDMMYEPMTLNIGSINAWT